jgi:hypothetical protein
LTADFNRSLILTYDYAVSGSIVQNATDQIQQEFLPYLGKQPSWAPWTSNNSVFCTSHCANTYVVTWIGNNDVWRDYDLTSQLDILFAAEEQLYDAGARNFVFINVVPYDHSPSG